MTDSNDFLAAIIDRPDDDLPRLVYADFLDETGDPARAEFIRVQCELARLPADHPGRSALAAREAELLAAHKPAWVVPRLRGPQHFRRGFVEVIETAADWLIAAAGWLFRTTPVRELRVGAVSQDRQVDALVRLPGLARVEALDLTNTGFRAAHRLLADAPLGSLKRLTLRNAQLWPEHLQTLARAPVAPRLEALNVSGNPFADEGAEILANDPAFAGLRELVARGDDQRFEFCVHGTGAAALAGSRTLTRLRHLNLSDQYVGDAGLIGLAGSPNSASLTDLDLGYNEVGDTGERGIEALVESPHLRNLTRVRLAGNRIDRLAADALAHWPALATGARVNLTDCEIDPAGRAALAASPWAGQFVLDE